MGFKLVFVSNRDTKINKMFLFKTFCSKIFKKSFENEEMPQQAPGGEWFNEVMFRVVF
jgi:hypothetical protein